MSLAIQLILAEEAETRVKQLSAQTGKRINQLFAQTRDLDARVDFAELLARCALMDDPVMQSRVLGLMEMMDDIKDMIERHYERFEQFKPGVDDASWEASCVEMEAELKKLVDEFRLVAIDMGAGEEQLAMIDSLHLDVMETHRDRQRYLESRNTTEQP
jgi:hypothetical protein